MAKLFPAFIVAGLLAVSGWLLWGSVNPDARPALGGATTSTATSTEKKPHTYECDADGKICEDGSIVGRTGPLCEFAACPHAFAKSATIRTTMGQVMTGLKVAITPHEVVDDSRCPAEVQCIWAGTAHVKTSVTTPEGASDVTFELGHAETVGSYTITFTELTPAKQSGETIPDSSYRFTFIVSKK